MQGGSESGEPRAEKQEAASSLQEAAGRELTSISNTQRAAECRGLRNPTDSRDEDRQQREAGSGQETRRQGDKGSWWGPMEIIAGSLQDFLEILQE